MRHRGHPRVCFDDLAIVRERGKGVLAHQVLIDAFVQLPLRGAALPELLIPLLEAFPVPPELSEAVRVDILEPVFPSASVKAPSLAPRPCSPLYPPPLGQVM